MASHTLGRLRALTQTDKQQLARNDHGLIKSRNALSRIFNIEVNREAKRRFSLHATELELRIHFVNKDEDPAGNTVLKKYWLRADDNTTKFLARL